MIKYVKAINTGNGFITHEDQDVYGLRFDNFNGLITITGNELDIDNWIKRIKGVEITEQDYIKEKAEKEKKYAEDELVNLEIEKVNLQTKVAEKVTILNNLSK